MSSKAKAPIARIKLVSSHAMDSASLVAKADASLTASRYKEAIELYKELIKRERQADWIDGLASCYAGRAQELASKGMVKEALVLWRNRTQLCGKTLAEGPYFAWLLQAGEQVELFRLMNVKTLSDAAHAELEITLASTVLAATNDALSDLPADSALMRHRSIVLAALAAYHRGDFRVLEEQLQAIPFRSPYRDLKPTLKALALLQTDVVEARKAIARLPSGGPFERLVVVLRSSILPDWLTALRDLDDDSRHLVLDIKGCPDARRPLLLELAKLSEKPSATALFDLLLRHRRTIPEVQFSNLAHRLMPHLIQRQVISADFESWPNEEKMHIMALCGELKGAHDAAQSNWVKMADFLSAKPEQKLRAALIWRHVAELDGMDSAATFECLKKSLELDPKDRDSTLAVIRVLRSENNLSQARVYLDKALTIFPNDAGVLLEAVEVALASKAFKKAVGLAKRVLVLDPINPKVRGLIGHGLFSHARKQIKLRNKLAARKELDAAEEWLRSKTELATLKLLRALASEVPTHEVDVLLRGAVADFGGFLVGAFHLLLEADKTDHNPKNLLLGGGISLAATPTPADIIALVKSLDAAGTDEKTLHTAFGPLRGLLKRAVVIHFSEADHLLVCEVLQRIRENELLFAYSEAALQRWPGRPEFVYFRVLSRYGSNLYRIPDRELEVLDRAENEARKKGDSRTASRIGLLLAPLMEVPSFPNDDPFGSFNDYPDSPHSIVDLMESMIGKEAVTELKNQFGGHPKDFIYQLMDIMAGMGSTPPNKPPPRKKNRPPPIIQKGLFDD